MPSSSKYPLPCATFRMNSPVEATVPTLTTSAARAAPADKKIISIEQTSKIVRLNFSVILKHITLFVLAAFAHLSAAVCMRFHSVLFAHRMGVPVVPVSYAPKVTTWLAEHSIAPVPTSGRAWTDAISGALAERALDPPVRLAS